MKNLKNLVADGLFPKKLTVSRTFDVRSKSVKVEAAYSPLDDVVAVNVRITDPVKPLSFGMLTSKSYDYVDCALFGTRVVACGLKEKLPPCRKCPLGKSE